MKVMVMIEGSGADEDKITPTEGMPRETGAYNEQLVQADIMLDGQGLHPTRAGTVSPPTNSSRPRPWRPPDTSGSC